MKHHPRFEFLLILTCAVNWSCAGGRTQSDSAPPFPEGDHAQQAGASSSERPNSEVGTVWGYLEANYDQNGDGVISAREYTRNSNQFSLWDRDADGTLSASDFAPEPDQDGAGSRGPGGRMSMGRARRTLARYFQMDEDAGLLPLVEAQEAFAQYDGADGSQSDGKLTEEEFLVLSAQRLQSVPGDELSMVQRAMGDSTPWEAMLTSLDQDLDRELTLAELQAFFGDVMETETIDYRDWGDRFSADSESEPEADGLAAQEGQSAPDFTLSSPDGKHTYRLQDFRGDRPVALIFGSYT